MKHTIIAAMIAIIAAFSMSSAAQAGKWKGKGGFKFKSFGHHHHFKHYKYRGYRSCYRYKKLYLKTGRKFWLRKYKICRYY